MENLFSYDFKRTDEYIVIYTDCILKKDVFAIRKIFKGSFIIDKIEQLILKKGTHFHEIFYEKESPNTLYMKSDNDFFECNKKLFEESCIYDYTG